METIKNHHPGCAKAKRHKCECHQCDGMEHGWVGGIELARATDVERKQRRQEIELDWRKSYVQKKRKRPNKENKAASIDFVRMDLVDWLASKLTWRVRVRWRGTSPSVTKEQQESKPFEVDLVDAPVISHRPSKRSVHLLPS